MDGSTNKLVKLIEDTIDDTTDQGRRERDIYAAGWCRAVEAVRGTVKEYPDLGGDIVIMEAIDRLREEAYTEGYEEAYTEGYEAGARDAAQEDQ